MKRQLILSSSSPARKALLSRLQIEFTCVSPDIDETPIDNEIPEALVKRLSLAKAKIVSERFPDALIIGSDCVGILDHHLLNKPITIDQAKKQLKLVSGKTVRFLTGLCLLDAATEKYQLAAEKYDVHFQTLSDATIANYLHKDNPVNCAGSFHAEGLGITLIEKFSGDDYTTLIGLPLIRLVLMLKNAGFDVLE